MFGGNFLSAEVPCSGSSFLQVLRDYRNPGQHALVKLRRDNKQFLFLVVDGKLHPTCIISGNSYTVMSTAKIIHDDWSGAKLAHGCLPSFALRAAKIWFSASPPPEVEKLAAGDFVASLKKYQGAQQPGLLWAQSETDEFLIFLPGEEKAIDHVVDTSAGTLLADPLLISAFLERDRLEVEAAYFAFTDEIEAWKEYRLHRRFCEINEAFLHRYGELTGKVMTQALMRTATLFAANYDWPIEFRMGRVIDQLTLANLKQQQQTYQYILAHMLDQASLSIGKKLTVFLLSDYTNSAPKDRRAEILSLLPEIYGCF